jgi:hypothetical protein
MPFFSGKKNLISKGSEEYLVTHPCIKSEWYVTSGSSGTASLSCFNVLSSEPKTKNHHYYFLEQSVI